MKPVDDLPRPVAALTGALLARRGVARKPVLTADKADAAGLPDVLVARLVRDARATKPRAAFTLRLDAERRMRLRLATALTGRSAQQLVTDAIDTMLGDIAELEPLLSQVASIEGPRQK